VEGNKYFVCVCGGGEGLGRCMSCLHACRLTYPVCHTLAPGLHPLWLHLIFQRYLINTVLLRRKVTEHKMCLLIFTATCLKHFSFQENSAKYCHKCEKSACKLPVIFCPILMKLEFSTDLKKSVKYEVISKSSSGSQVVPCRQTDERT
jgi:hypothetical protein